MVYRNLFFPALLCCFGLLVATFTLRGQCDEIYGIMQPAVLPDDCAPNIAFDLAKAVNTCKTVCIDLTQATSSHSPVPECGTGRVAHDVWWYLRDPYQTIANYDGSLVFAWKDFPGYPDADKVPTVATHIEFDGKGKLGFIPVFSSQIDCSDGFGRFENAGCSDYNSDNFDLQAVITNGAIPTNSELEERLEATKVVSSASINSIMTYSQAETYDNVPGRICFEVSTYAPGFSCGDPIVLEHDGLEKQSHVLKNCLCQSAQNSGYFNPQNRACGTPEGDELAPQTTAFYRIDVPYDCRNISVELNDWRGEGGIDANILYNIDCPDHYVTNRRGKTIRLDGLVVNKADVAASGCLSVGDELTATSNAPDGCLPAGSYYVLLSGNRDKASFEVKLSVR